VNQEDLLNAIGSAREDMLEQTEAKKKPVQKKVLFFAAAACVCLLLTSVLQWFLPFPLPGQKISYERIGWNMKQKGVIYHESSVEVMTTFDRTAPYQYAHDMSIQAKVLAVLDDTYSFAGASTGTQRYRILQLKVLDTIVGEGFPEVIYYMLPDHLSPYLKEYDSLILTLKQYSMENGLLINTTRQRAETFDFLFCEGRHKIEHFGMMAFKDGKLDLGLWEKLGWKDSFYASRFQEILKNGNTDHPGAVNRSIDEIKNLIKKQYEKYASNSDIKPVISNATFDWPEAQELLSYVEPFDNGMFATRANPYGANSLEITRVINGFATNERYYLDADDQTIHESNRFTEEDLKKLPNIERLVSKLDNIFKDVKPKRASLYGVGGWYCKVDNEVYGVLVACWGKERVNDAYGIKYIESYGESFLLVAPDGSYRIVTRDEAYEYI